MIKESLFHTVYISNLTMDFKSSITLPKSLANSANCSEEAVCCSLVAELSIEADFSTSSYVSNGFSTLSFCFSILL